MSTLAVPRRIERILESLGADPTFCEDVVGDLREEFAIRAAWDGQSAARRWYYRESLRVAPHLLRSWLCGLGWRDALRLGGVIACSVLAVGALQTIEGTVAQRLAQFLGVPARRVLSFGMDLGPYQILLLWNSLAAVVCGYFAASISRRARVPGALVMTAFWGVFISIAWYRFPLFPTWFAATNLAMCLSGTVLGGILRAARATALQPGASIR